MGSSATQAPEDRTVAHGSAAATRSIRRLLLAGRPGALGEAHGARFREEIRRYADERVHLASNGSWAGHAATREDVLGLAEAMLPAHRAYAPDLYEEMEAMARASGLSPAEAVVVGGFTDFVDAVRAQGGSPAQEDDCTAALVPGNVADGSAFLAQTWDMHDSATEHVVMLELRPETGPRALVFSTVGCLGQIGVNEAGICVGINNLHAAAGRTGVVCRASTSPALTTTCCSIATAVATTWRRCPAGGTCRRSRRRRSSTRTTASTTRCAVARPRAPPTCSTRRAGACSALASSSPQSP
jgi:hypothetical protein